MNKTSLYALILSTLTAATLVAQEAPIAHEPYTPENTILVFDIDETLLRRTITVREFLWQHSSTLFWNLGITPRALKLLCNGATAHEYIELCEKQGRQDVADAIKKIAQSTIIIPGMKEFIEERKKEGYELHLATNQFARGFEVYKKSHPEFFAQFDYAYVGTPAHDGHKKIQKPHLDYYEDYLAKTPSKKPYRFLWDDRKANIIGAHKAGIDGAVFTNAEQAEKDFKKNFAPTAHYQSESKTPSLQPTTP